MFEIMWAAAIVAAWGLAIWLGWKMGADHGRRRLTWRMRLAGWRAVASSLWRHRGNRREMVLEVQALEAKARAEAVGGKVPVDENGEPILAYLRFRHRESGDEVDLLGSGSFNAQTAELLVPVGSVGHLEWGEIGGEPQAVKAHVTRHVDIGEDGEVVDVIFDLLARWVDAE